MTTAVAIPGLLSSSGCIAHDEVHTWWAQLDVPRDRLQQLAGWLELDEFGRASRFKAARHRERWIAGRGLLRELLGDYIGVLPSSVRLVYGPHGKPSLAPGSCDPDLRFSLAHSDGLILFALTRNRDVGVDLEAVRPLKDLDLIAEQFFSAHERATLRSLHAEQRLDGFFNCWSRKEAYLKAVGVGLSMPLDAFDVEFSSGAPARLLAVEGRADLAAGWNLHALQAPAGFAAAVATTGVIRRVTQRWLESAQ